MAKHAESGRTRSQRKKHDQSSRAYQQKTGNPYHLSTTARDLIAVVIVMVIVAVTALFVGGLIRW